MSYNLSSLLLCLLLLFCWFIFVGRWWGSGWIYGEVSKKCFLQVFSSMNEKVMFSSFNSWCVYGESGLSIPRLKRVPCHKFVANPFPHSHLVKSGRFRCILWILHKLWVMTITSLFIPCCSLLWERGRLNLNVYEDI